MIIDNTQTLYIIIMRPHNYVYTHFSIYQNYAICTLLIWLTSSLFLFSRSFYFFGFYVMFLQYITASCHTLHTRITFPERILSPPFPILVQFILNIIFSGFSYFNKSYPLPEHLILFIISSHRRHML